MPIQGERSAPMPDEFKPMTEFPEPANDGSNCSKTVLVYDENELDYAEIGYYSFETNEWVVFGDFSLKLICWRYAPKPDKKDVEGYTSVKHRGYQD